MGEEEVEKHVLPESPEIVVSKGGNVRRNFTGQASARASLPSLPGSEKVLPHYLRASTNSCHDFCKYGRKHAFEEKAKRPIRRKQTVETGTSVESEDHLKCSNVTERKKGSLNKPNGAPDLKIELLEKPKVIKKNASPSAKKTEISTEPVVTPNQEQVEVKSLSQTTRSTVSGGRINSPKSPLSHTSHGVNGTRDGGSIGTSGSGSKVGSKNSVRSPASSSSALSGGTNSKKLSKNSLDGSLTVRGNSETKMGKNTSLSKLGERNLLKKPMVSSSPKPSIKRVSSFKSIRYRAPKIIHPKLTRNKVRKEPNNQQKPDEALYVMEPRPEDKSLKHLEIDETVNQSSQSSLSLTSLPSCPSFSSDEERIDKESKAKHTGEESTTGKNDVTGKSGTRDSKGGDKRKTRSATVNPQGKDTAAQKLNFQRGKEVSAETENSTPRRLKVKPGRVEVVSVKTENSAPSRLKVKPGRVVMGNQKNLKSVVNPEAIDTVAQKSKFQRGKVVNVETENNVAKKSKLQRGKVVNVETEKTVAQKSKFQRGKGANVESENTVAQKSKFQRGKVVNTEIGNSTPRRLRFRPGRVLTENQKSVDSDNNAFKRFKFRQGRVVGLSLSGRFEIGRRSFRRNKDAGSGDLGGKTPIVFLRHRDVQAKKEEKVLFNEVIEETANKLVETRKSKVKALVGAFETVISLQESKPVAAI